MKKHYIMTQITHTDSEQAQLMVVDDDPDEKYIINRTIKKSFSNLDIISVNDGREALDYLDMVANEYTNKNNNIRFPDLILLDINMPRMNGFETLEAIRSSNAYFHIPTVIYTTSSDMYDVESSYRSGADSYIIKPLDLACMKQTLEGFCNYWLNTLRNASCH